LRPGRNIKTKSQKRFEFTPETVVRNVLVAQVVGVTLRNITRRRGSRQAW